MYIPDALIKHWAGLSNDVLAAPPTLVQLTILNGESLSSVAVIPAGMRCVGLTTPTDWTDCDMSFQISFDGSTFYEVTNGNSTLLPDAVTGVKGGYSFYFSIWNTFRASFFKARSGSALSPSAQGGDRVLNLICVNCNAADH